MSENLAPLTVTPTASGAIQVTWGWKRAIITVLCLLTPFLLLFIASELSSPSDEKLTASDLIVEIAVTVAWDAAAVLVVFWTIHRSGSHRDAVGFRWPPLTNGQLFAAARRPLRSFPYRRALQWVGGVVTGYICCLVIIGVYTVLISLTGVDSLSPSAKQQVPDEIFAYPIVTVLMGIAVIVVAPFAEETLFRGFLFGALRRRFPFIIAAMISGLCFSVAHLDLGVLIPFTVIGMLFAYAYERSGTILGSMSLHFIFNAVSFSLLVLAH